MCGIQYLPQIGLEQSRHTHEDPNQSLPIRFHPQPDGELSFLWGMLAAHGIALVIFTALVVWEGAA
jgi:hypothetical protein